MENQQNDEIKISRKIKPDVSKLDDAINPLTAGDFVIYVNTIHRTITDVNGDKTVAEIEMEAQHNTKLYGDARTRDNAAELGASAKSLYLWILHDIKPSDDYYYLNTRLYMGRNRVNSINTVKQGIEELIDYGYIAVSKLKSVYWINPRLFMGGSRINKYPKRVVKK